MTTGELMSAGAHMFQRTKSLMTKRNTHLNVDLLTEHGGSTT